MDGKVFHASVREMYSDGIEKRQGKSFEMEQRAQLYKPRAHVGVYV